MAKTAHQAPTLNRILLCHDQCTPSQVSKVGRAVHVVIGKRAAVKRQVQLIKRVEKMLQDPSIVRNRLKVKSAVTNAKAFLTVQQEFASFSDYVWGFVSGKPIQNNFRNDGDVPATSPESDALSKDLKMRGFKFVGSTIIYAHMQATGMVNDHVTGCFRRRPCAAMAKQKR